ncbi:dephospho-CoA kinase [Candidatus Aerophobetes bacterium]|nr:dephospho-CoA kinase [Candidatus Aerophobetes bacterium]
MKMVIGVTGNIGSGKTTTVNIFKELGAKIIEADKVGHFLLKREDVKEKLISIFGKSILDKRNGINRQKLRKIVFNEKEKLEKLNSILHPLIAEEIKREINKTKEGIIIVEAAILLEAGWDFLVDKVIMVSAPDEVKLKRAQKSRQINILEIEKIMKSQLSEKKMREKADFIIENKEGIKELRDKVENLWNKFCLILQENDE